MTGLKRNFAASSDNELVVSLRRSGGQVTHFAWACPIKSNRRWPSGLVGSRTGPRLVPFTGVLWKVVTVVSREDARVLLSFTIVHELSPQKPHTRTPLCLFPCTCMYKICGAWRVIGVMRILEGLGCLTILLWTHWRLKSFSMGPSVLYMATRELSHCICNMITIGDYSLSLWISPIFLAIGVRITIITLTWDSTPSLPP